MFFKEVKSINRILKEYWNIYGGFRALLHSPYLWLAFFISLICHVFWTNSSLVWSSLVVDIIPSLLGFTLGGYAVWLAIGDKKYKQLLMTPMQPEDYSHFLDMNVCFVHFIIVQTLTLIFALLGYVAGGFWLVDFFGFWLLCYALLGVISITFSIFSYAKVLEEYTNLQQSQQDSTQKNNNET